MVLGQLTPLRERAASTGGLAPLLAALAAFAARPFKGHTVCIRPNTAAVTHHESVDLGGGSSAQRLLLTIPATPLGGEDAAQPVAAACSLWLVSASLGDDRRETRARALCVWLASSPRTAAAVLVVGDALGPSEAFTAFGLKPLADVGAEGRPAAWLKVGGGGLAVRAGVEAAAVDGALVQLELLGGT